MNSLMYIMLNTAVDMFEWVNFKAGLMNRRNHRFIINRMKTINLH